MGIKTPKSMMEDTTSLMIAPPCLSAPNNTSIVRVKPVCGANLEIEAGDIMTVGHLKDEICARGGAPPSVVTLLLNGVPLADDELLPVDAENNFSELQLQYFLVGGGSGMGSGSGKGGGFEMVPFSSWKEGFCWFRCLCEGVGCDCPSAGSLIDPLQHGKCCCIESDCAIKGFPDIMKDNWCEDKCLCHKSDCGPKNICTQPFQLFCLKVTC